jgi:hypothetical protein
MTVGELRKTLESFDSTLPVVLWDDHGCWEVTTVEASGGVVDSMPIERDEFNIGLKQRPVPYVVLRL